MKDKIFAGVFALFVIFISFISFRALWSIDQFSKQLEQMHQRVKVVENRIIDQITPRVANNESRILSHQTDDHVTHKDLNRMEQPRGEP